MQEYQYLLVLDFEATCWEKTNNSHFVRPEIIEFSVVLYKIASNEIVEQFQQYVMPTENYKLSEFCINLTGITQEQVDNGIPIGTCLMLFSQWIKEQEQLHKIVLYKNSSIKGNCIFVTWSDWDLGNCLVRECKRKRIKRADYFKNWTDLRALYMVEIFLLCLCIFVRNKRIKNVSIKNYRANSDCMRNISDRFFLIT